MTPTPATILVVEDNPITRKLIHVALRSEGYQVLLAPDGKTALDLVTRQPVDLILQDLLLPDLNGFDLVTRFRALPAVVGIPILVISGHLSQIDQAHSLQLGFTDFLCKPVEPSHLLLTVRAYLRPAGSTPLRQARQGRVVVVDDDPVQLKLLRIQLENLGFQVSTAAGGEQALDLIRQALPAALVSDVLMPGLDGFRLCLAIRQDARSAQLPVILTSAVFIDEADQELARQVGANAFIRRTSDHREVAEALLNCLQGGLSPLPTGGPVGLPLEQYTHRVIRQLEHHVGLSGHLTRRLSLLEAELGILARIVETLHEHPVVSEQVLQEMLFRCLHAAGISRGAAYLLDSAGRLSLRAHLGYPEAGLDQLEDFFGHIDLLHQVLEQGEPIEVRVADGERDLAANHTADLLASAGAQSLLLTPLLLRDERLGVLGMASASRELGPDWLSFAKVVGGQISQAIELARTLTRLNHSEQRYRELLESAPDAVVVVADDGRIIQVNRQTERFFGYPRGELMGQPVEILLPEESRDRHILHRSEYLAQPTIRPMGAALALCGRRKDGSEFPVEISLSPLPSGEGTVIFCAIRDVTARARASEALRASEKRFRLLFERNLAGIVRATVEGRILDCNDAFARILGYDSTSEVLHRRVADLYFDPAQRDVVIAQFRDHPNMTSQEVCLRKRDGEPVWVLANASWLEDLEGAVIQGTIIDITERKQAEEQRSKLRLAREVQQHLFPSRSARLPGFDIGGGSYPAEATGGDYFDHLPLPNGSLVLAIGDVSGHGFGPALLMAETRAYLRALALTRCDVGDIIALVNRALVNDILEDHFVTLLLGQLDPSSTCFRYTNAGHTRGYILDAANKVKSVLDSTGIPLGIDANSTFDTSSQIALEPGDLVLLLTDGIVEARPPDGTLFGSERALNVMRLYRNDSAHQLVENLYYAVRTFSQHGPQDDDITLLILKVEPVDEAG